MGKGLILKVAAYMRPKCHALLLDDAINLPTTVRLNIYQVRGPAAKAPAGSVYALGTGTHTPAG
jgi:hypothetical protein